jgi:hypothetical protein
MTFYTPLSKESEKTLKEFGFKEEPAVGTNRDWFLICIENNSYFRSYHSLHEKLPYPLIKTKHLRQLLICHLL